MAYDDYGGGGYEAPDNAGGNPFNTPGLNTQTPYEEPDTVPGYYGRANPSGLPIIDPGDSQFASKTRANIARAEWEDWLNRFLPVLEEQIGNINNPEERAKAVNRAQESVDTTFGNSRETLDRRRSQYGLQLDPTERASSDRRMGLAHAKQRVAATNATRQLVEDRDLQMAAGGLSMGAG